MNIFVIPNTPDAKTDRFTPGASRMICYNIRHDKRFACSAPRETGGGMNVD